MHHRALLKLFLTVAITLVSISLVSAADWSSSNIQLLHGTDYQLGEEKRTILTFEHSNRWGYGDNYFFVDITEPNGKGTTHYAEFSPRLSVSKLSGWDASHGIIKDTYVAASLEMGDGLHGHLIGLGTSLALPGFNYANANIMRRETHRDWVTKDTDAGWQLTLNWGLTFMLSKSKWQFEGFLDYAFSEDGGSHPKADNMITAPRLLLDTGHLWEAPNYLFTGIEYQIWRNKFGVDGVNENVSQLMVKWVF